MTAFPWVSSSRIFKLDVPVDDALAVQVTQPRKDLSEEKPGDLLMSHRLPPDDGRLPLQVLGDLGLLDLVKCHHLQSHLLVQNDVVGQDHFAEGPLAKGGWGQLVVAD